MLSHAKSGGPGRNRTTDTRILNINLEILVFNYQQPATHTIFVFSYADFNLIFTRSNVRNPKRSSQFPESRHW
jgi:hypothetical protein